MSLALFIADIQDNCTVVDLVQTGNSVVFEVIPEDVTQVNVSADRYDDIEEVFECQEVYGTTSNTVFQFQELVEE